MMREERRRVTLQEAVRQRLVRVEVRGLGEGVTSAIKLNIVKLTDAPLAISIPRGTEFAPIERPRARRGGEEAPR